MQAYWAVRCLLLPAAAAPHMGGAAAALSPPARPPLPPAPGTQGRHITDFADDQRADMLVLGSRGMGGVKRTFLGMVRGRGGGAVQGLIEPSGCTLPRCPATLCVHLHGMHLPALLTPAPTPRVLPPQVGLGSVSDYVTKHAACNVVVHKMAVPQA